MRPFDYVEMRVPAKSQYVGVARLTISGLASRIGFSFDDIEDLKIASSEAVTNAVQHAYSEGEEGARSGRDGVHRGQGHSRNAQEGSEARRQGAATQDRDREQLGLLGRVQGPGRLHGRSALVSSLGPRARW